MSRESAKGQAPAAPEGGALLFHRRTFLKGVLGLGLLSLGLPGCGADAKDSGRPQAAPGTDTRIPVIWLETGVCTGCAEALLDSTNPSADSLLGTVRIEFQETLMDLSGAAAIDRVEALVQEYGGRYALIVDGAIPTGDFARLTTLGVGSDGQELTAEALVKRFAAGAAAVVALGTCAAWGGIPASGANPCRFASVADVTGGQVVRLPGCPPHGEWIAGSLVALLTGAALPLDSLGRPTAYYGATVHDTCPRRAHFDADEYATSPGDPELCLFEVGCRGPIAAGDCTARPWNGQSSCIGANHPCRGCTNATFPDPSTDKGV